MTENKVDILLASYNGEVFISKQIESILEQSFSNFRLIISDDGSTDKTWDIVLDFARKDNRIELVNNRRKGGVVENFNTCIQYSTASYIMFCDQDDIWPTDKVEEMLSAIINMENQHGLQPMLGFSDLTVVNQDLKTIHQGFYSYLNMNPIYNTDLRYIQWRSTVYGCTCIFNRCLMIASIPMPNSVPMHDHWFALKAAIHGMIFYHNQSTILYRQHGNNVVGASKKSLSDKLYSFIKIIKSIKKYSSEVKRMIGELRKSEQQKIQLHDIKTLLGRIKFVKTNILPFVKERPIFTLFFVVFFLTSCN